MELWIRSQDKKILTKADSLILTNTGDIKSGNDIDAGITLASYCPSYRRALEVLDEIQNALIVAGVSIEECERNNINIENYFAVNKIGNFAVYQMPKE